MNIYDLLQEENQRFWEFLDLDQAMLDAQNLATEDVEEAFADKVLEEV